MIPKECKRLAEVDFPIAIVSKHSAAENTGRLGHPHTLHKWWARRPLGACRAMLLGLLLPDPCDEHCPPEFKTKARSLLTRTEGSIDADDMGLRKAMLDFIGDFAAWEMSSSPTYLEIGRGLVKAAHPEETPLVVDPFAGGGSIPLESLRLGCEAFSGDLNPVASLIQKVLLNDIPRQGSALADELRCVGQDIQEKAAKELAEFYPKAPDGATPIAYLWARTVRCESPHCGAEIPLVRSFWLCKKANRKYALQYDVLDGSPPEIAFEVFKPKRNTDVPTALVNNGRAVCPACSNVVPPSRVQAQLTERGGGADSSKLLAVICIASSGRGREYRVPSQLDVEAIADARVRFMSLMQKESSTSELSEPICPVRPSPNARGVSAPTRYGIRDFGGLFTPRQRLVLLTFAKLIRNAEATVAARHLLALALNKVAMQCTAHCRWKASGESLVDMFGRHAISMVWDFAESVPLTGSAGGWMRVVASLGATVEGLSQLHLHPAQVVRADARSCGLPDEAAHIWFTDPPYYDNIPYADLSDFFFVLLKHSLGEDAELGMPVGQALTPKEKEIVWNCAHVVDGKPKGPEFFEQGIAQASKEGRRILLETGVGSVVFAHKTTEGWEALLTGITEAGWVITASWPIATELASRVSARDSASLATSVHLVCRPRPEDAPVGDWANVLRELPGRVGDWMERLQGEGIRGADLVFACIGPALEIFSRYRKVETAEGREVELAEYLEKVWEVVGRTALEQVLGTAEAKARNGAAGAIEEDARLTALFLWTLQSTNGDVGNADSEGEDEGEEVATRAKSKGFSLPFDMARRFAQPMGIDLPKWEGRIIKTEKGVVRLLPVSERAKQLFGDDGAKAAADWIETDASKDLQQMLFPEMQEQRVPKVRGRGRRKAIMDAGDVELHTEREATTLDRIHAAMLFQAGGQANALRALLKAEQDRGPDFLRLANALSALYPKSSEEKRLLDAMLLAVPR